MGRKYKVKSTGQPKASAAPRRAQPDRRMEGLRVAIRVPNVPSGPMCSSKASGSRLRHGVDDAFGGCPRKNPDIWGCFQGTWDSLGQDASSQAEEMGVPSALDVDLQPGQLSQW